MVNTTYHKYYDHVIYCITLGQHSLKTSWSNVSQKGSQLLHRCHPDNFKGHVIAAACAELGVGSPIDINEELLRLNDAKEILSLLGSITTKVSDKCTIMY